MTTIVIPAHNEGRVIGRLLGPIAPAARAGELTVLVVANGCDDDTAEVAASFGPCVQVVSIPVASKYQALRTADRHAPSFPRIYVDADVQISAPDLLALAAALDQPGVLAASPGRRLALAGRPWPVRWYYDVWSRLPEVSRGLWGRGVIAVTEPGQRRLASLPPVLGDDLAASLSFAPHERVIVTGTEVIVHTPYTLADLMRRRVRSATVTAQLHRAPAGPVPLGRSGNPPPDSARSERTRLSHLTSIVRAEPRTAPRVALFLGLTMVARTRARRAAARGDFTTWLRDESSRTAAR
jgi:hypothetical protein